MWTLGVVLAVGALGALYAVLDQEPIVDRTAGAAAPSVACECSGEHAALTAAVEELTRELRALREREPAPAHEPVSGREPLALPGSGSDAAAIAELRAAVERLSAAVLELRASGSGLGVAPLSIPPSGKKLDALRALAAMEREALRQELRFLSYQQVLDRVGQPDQIHEGQWYYREENEGWALAIHFWDGYVIEAYSSR